MKERNRWPVVAPTAAVVLAGVSALILHNATQQPDGEGKQYPFATISGIDCTNIPLEPQLRYEYTKPHIGEIEQALLQASDEAQKWSQHDLVADACAVIGTRTNAPTMEAGDVVDITYTVQHWTTQKGRYAWGIGSLVIEPPQHDEAIQVPVGPALLGQFTVN